MVTLNSSEWLADETDNDTSSSSPLEEWSLTSDANYSTETPTRSHTMVLQAPSYSALRTQLKWGFLLHTYGFACLFFVLAFYAFFSIMNLRALISSRPFMSTINGFLCLLGASRAACLFIDPYNLKKSMPKVMASVMWDVGFPCLISAFCLVQLAFLQLTQSGHLDKHKLCELSHGAAIYIFSPWTQADSYMLKLGPEKMRRKSCLSLIITAHFSFILGSDIVVTFQDQLMVLKYVFQTLFLVWGVFLCCSFLYGGYKVMCLLRGMPGGLLQRDPSNTQHKGIMQLAMLAPYNNLAGSVAATLMTTVLTPKIRITDEDEQTFSFTSDNNLQRGGHDPQTRAANKTREEDVWSGSDEECRSPGSPRPAVRPGSPDPRRKAPVPVGVLPSILVSPCSRKSSLANRRGSDISNLNDNSRRGSDCSRRGSDISKQGDNFSRRLGGDLTRRSSDTSRRGSDLASRRGSECSNLADIAEDNVSVALVSSTALSLAKKKKNLTWKAGEGPNSCGGSKRKPFSQGGAMELGEDDITAETTLLPQASTGCSQDKGDLTLHSILNHIAYVNKAALSGGEDPNDEQGSSRKSQVQRVLHVTYTTAILGLSLCAADLGRLYGPYGLMAATSNVTRGINDDPDGHTGSERGPRPWPWFCFQTLCRAVEFAMGCAMANITKQPVHSRHQQYSYSLRLKHKESLYI